MLLHGALPSLQRVRAVHAFRIGDDTKILVCTDVAARGLDFPRLRHVVMYDGLSADVSKFVHCAGRTARRGHRGVVTCLSKSQHMRSLTAHQGHHALHPAPKLKFVAVPTE